MATKTQIQTTNSLNITNTYTINRADNSVRVASTNGRWATERVVMFDTYQEAIGWASMASGL